MGSLTKKEIKELEKLESKDSKCCTKCKQVKSLTNFHFHPTGRKFSAAHCIECDQERHKESYIRYNHGITLQDYDKILEEQGGKCKICGVETPGGRGRFHIDHDHVTGKIRGLLCSSCNTGLGLFKDDANILIAAAHYLNDSRE